MGRTRSTPKVGLVVSGASAWLVTPAIKMVFPSVLPFLSTVNFYERVIPGRPRNHRVNEADSALSSVTICVHEVRVW